mgnify:CR=1 FL=1
MIIAKIQGGLGNQMFQYAFGRVLALRNHTELKLDATMFEGYIHRYTMDHLNIKDIYATPAEISSFTRYRTHNTRLGRWLLNPLFADKKRYVIEPAFTFVPEMLNLKEPCMVDGYWQSEKYFLEIENLLRKEFTLREPLGKYSQEIAAKISSTEHPVFLHIRRGDFAHHPTYSKIHGVCPPEYYEAAKGIIKEKVGSPTYFVFSDDIDWARENIKTDFPTEYIGQGPDKNYEDMELMRLCEHRILANSTFGWWGAWLSDTYRTGITIAPKQWNIKLNTKDLLPTHWTVLPF